MFQGSLKFQGCFEGVLRVFQGSFKKTFKVFQKSFMLHGTHRSFPSRRRACFFGGHPLRDQDGGSHVFRDADADVIVSRLRDTLKIFGEGDFLGG